MAASRQFGMAAIAVAVDGGVVEMEIAGVADVISGLRVSVAVRSTAFVGGRVAVTKSGGGETDGFTAMEMQEVSETSADR